jgi:hypothetical protein
MAIPTTRDDFKAFVLRALGDGVLQVNVSDDQVEDRIDQAFYMFNQFHMDSTVKTYLKHEVTPSVMNFIGPPSVPFNNNEVIIGATSNAHGQVVAPAAVANANAIFMFGTNGPVAFIETGPTTPQAGDGKPFVEGEVVSGVQSGAVATVAVSGDLLIFQSAFTGTFTPGEKINGLNGNVVYLSTVNSTAIVTNTKLGSFTVSQTLTGAGSGAHGTFASYALAGFTALVLGDMDLKYIAIPESIIAINKIFAPFDSRISADILFDPQAQFNISLLSNFTSTSIIPYVIGRQYQQLLNDTFRGRPGIRFSRHQQRLYCDVNWYSTFQPHQFLIVECYQVLDPATVPDIYSDRWLQDYTIALIKKQWATNLSKYTGVSLPGGVTLDAKTMKDEANEEIKDLEHQLDSRYSLPIDFITG